MAKSDNHERQFPAASKRVAKSEKASEDSLADWDAQIRAKIEAIRRSERLTQADFAVRINTK